MLSNDEILKTIDRVYAKRVEGDKGALATFWAADAKYQLMGDPRFLTPLPTGETAAAPANDLLIDIFKIEKLDRLDALIADNRAAIRWKLTVSARGKPSVETEILDLWELDDAGKIKSVRQFCDTALIQDSLA